MRDLVRQQMQADAQAARWVEAELQAALSARCEPCGGSGAVPDSGHWPHNVEVRCERCSGVGRVAA